MLNWHELPRKSTRQLKEQLEKGLTCTLLGCDEALSHKQGPGGNTLCRKHHKQMREYGGVGRLDRPHTFHRKWTCDWCGVDALEKVRKRYPHLEDTVTIIKNLQVDLGLAVWGSIALEISRPKGST